MKVDFFIVGAPKSATTSLFHYLSQHERISMSSIKEPDFFSHLELNKQKLYYKVNPISVLLNITFYFLRRKRVNYLVRQVFHIYFIQKSQRGYFHIIQMQRL